MVRPHQAHSPEHVVIGGKALDRIAEEGDVPRGAGQKLVHPELHVANDRAVARQGLSAHQSLNELLPGQGVQQTAWGFQNQLMPVLARNQVMERLASRFGYVEKNGARGIGMIHLSARYILVVDSIDTSLS